MEMETIKTVAIGILIVWNLILTLYIIAIRKYVQVLAGTLARMDMTVRKILQTVKILPDKDEL